VSLRILHVSDLHTGAGKSGAEAGPGPALQTLVDTLKPSLVIASGDLTHRNKAWQHDGAAALLKGLGVPVLAVPGNHDIPFASPKRLTDPWAEFERHWLTTEPTHSTPELHVVGINSVRPWMHQSGGVGKAALARAVGRLKSGHVGAFRIAVLHHQLVGPPWRSRKKPVAHRNHVLSVLAEAGAELIVGGHVHQGSVSDRHEFEIVDEGFHSAVVTTVPGLGRPRPHRHGEACGAFLYTPQEGSISVETYLWREQEWGITARRTFARGAGTLG
jgi:3',5'-cyclic AMP phosphodiesterase CpdA